MKKRMNEELYNNNNIENEVNKKVQAVVTPTYKQAIEDHELMKKNIEKDFKDQNKTTKEFLKKNHQRIPGKNVKAVYDEKNKIKLDESLFESFDENKEQLEEDDEDSDISDIEDRIYYKPKRDPLADIIQLELTNGEVVYMLNDDGSFTPRHSPIHKLNLDIEEDFGIGYDSKGDYIQANLDTEEMKEKVEEIGHRYKRETISGIRDNKVYNKPYWVKIYLKESDWDKPYFDPNVKIRPKQKRGRPTKK